MIVLDASMAIAWQFETESTERTDAVLDRVARSGALVPSIWRLEVANALRMAVRRKRCSNAELGEAVAQLLDLSIKDDRETAVHAWTTTLGLADDHSLTMYDAAYLELALRLRLPLASCDRELIVAARNRGVDVLTP